MADSVKVGGVEISNPDKIIFADKIPVKKIDVINYYNEAAYFMFPYIKNRILSIVRCPKGVSAPCFYKKHPDVNAKGVVKFPVQNSEGEEEEYFYIKDKSGILYEAQMGTVEFHLWGSKAQSLEKPDFMVFDLDPDEGMGLRQVRQGVKDLKSLLDSLSLLSFLKTSGGKGYHIVLPFKPSADWDAFRDFAKKVAQAMEYNWQELYTSNVRKEKRKGKIYIDWVRNGRGATSICPYSLRARKGLSASMPILWEELDSIAPNTFNMHNALEQIKKENPWKDFFTVKQRLKSFKF